MEIVDTTLRDGEQMAGIAIDLADKVKIAKLLDYIGVCQIEAGTPAMGGVEQESVKMIASLGLQSKISAWNRMNMNDIQASMKCNVDIIHMSVPASNLHIQIKLRKDQAWVKEHMKVCIHYAIQRRFEVHIGLEDASRASTEFLMELCEIAKQEGASRVRYADTVGVLTPRKAYDNIIQIKEKVEIPLGIHAHNDFGMAVANTLASVRAGVHYVDCTIGGVGERSGNCNLRSLLLAIEQQMNRNHIQKSNEKLKSSLDRLLEVEEEIMHIYYNRLGSNYNNNLSISCNAFSFA